MVVVATGVRYCNLNVPNFDTFEGQCVHCAATAMKAQLCAGEKVAVIGGGNSAGQAAVFLSRTVRHLMSCCAVGGACIGSPRESWGDPAKAVDGIVIPKSLSSASGDNKPNSVHFTFDAMLACRDRAIRISAVHAA